MRAWMWGGVAAGVTAGGVAWVFAGAGAPSHCGPCVVVARADSPAGCPASPPVVEVVDVATALARPPEEPAKLPFVSFDEPPLAAPAGVVPAGHAEPAGRPGTRKDEPQGAEPAPMPRPVEVAPAPRRAAAGF